MVAHGIEWGFGFHDVFRDDRLFMCVIVVMTLPGLRICQPLLPLVPIRPKSQGRGKQKRSLLAQKQAKRPVNKGGCKVVAIQGSTWLGYDK